MITVKEFAQKLKGEKSVALFCHIRPDGDTIGSALALSLALKKCGIKAEVFCEEKIAERFNFLPQVGSVKTTFDGEFTALCAVDCADTTRIGAFADLFIKHKNTYNIDHHVSNTRYAKVNCVIDRASNSENVLELIDNMGVELDKEIANLLATGITTDTGDFRHSNVTAETFANASKTKQAGADYNEICFHMFTEQTAERAKLFGLVMSDLRYFYDGRLCMITVSKKDIALSGASSDETEGFIDFIMGIKGVEVGICILEMEENKYKISFRSNGPDVNAVAGSFGGGGHVLASGCRLSGEYEEVVDKLRFAVSRELKD